MKSIREEIQNWLELVARAVKVIPFDKEVDWFDIESVYNGSHCDVETPTYIAYNGEELSFETVFSDAISIDHMCSEILNGDFEQAMRIIERYRGVKLVESQHLNKSMSINSLT